MVPPKAGANYKGGSCCLFFFWVFKLSITAAPMGVSFQLISLALKGAFLFIKVECFFKRGFLRGSWLFGAG